MNLIMKFKSQNFLEANIFLRYWPEFFYRNASGVVKYQLPAHLLKRLTVPTTKITMCLLHGLINQIFFLPLLGWWLKNIFTVESFTILRYLHTCGWATIQHFVPCHYYLIPYYWPVPLSYLWELAKKERKKKKERWVTCEVKVWHIGSMADG